jgi:hypothetical protein
MAERARPTESGRFLNFLRSPAGEFPVIAGTTQGEA